MGGPPVQEVLAGPPWTPPTFALAADPPKPEVVSPPLFAPPLAGPNPLDDPLPGRLTSSAVIACRSRCRSLVDRCSIARPPLEATILKRHMY